MISSHDVWSKERKHFTGYTGCSIRDHPVPSSFSSTCSSSAKQSKRKKKMKKKSETKALFNEGMCDSLNINYIFKTHHPYRISKKYDILLYLLYFSDPCTNIYTWHLVCISFKISFCFFLHSIFIHNILFLYIDNRIIVMSFRAHIYICRYKYISFHIISSTWKFVC